MSPAIRPAVPADLGDIAALAHALWPDATVEEHRAHAVEIFAQTASTLPLTLFVAEADGLCVGFIEVGLRSHADGCDGSRPVGFCEGWYVAPVHQKRGVGRALMEAACAWARAQGATELASDTWQDEEDSQAAHAACGFEVVDRCVHFRKTL